ncbi:MAG TPA: TRAP transporter small permease subunit [Paracoccaceae bacterium]|jgi:TRAP-type C4-dicarboxylate transport system permease small subunit|nr:TRAP transporter small permease subunit [Paracoccaceae bacterium]
MTDPNRPADGALADDDDLATQVNRAVQATELADMDAGLGPFDRAVNKVVEVLGVTVLATIVAIVFLNAAGRYLGGFILIWGDELVIGLLPWLGVLGMFLSIRRRQIIRIDFFVERMPAPIRGTLNFVLTLFAAATFVYLAMATFDLMQFFGNDRTIYLQIRKGWFMAALVIGPVLAALAYLLMAWDQVRRRPGH